MGAEIGATTSIFGYDKHMGKYLRATGRVSVADLADAHSELLCPDQDVIDNPIEFYDEYFEIDLNQLEPLLNGPFTPDRSTPISKMAEEAKKLGSRSTIGISGNTSLQTVGASYKEAMVVGLGD